MLRAEGSMLEIARIQSEINRLFDNLLELGGSAGEASRAWMPNSDISEGPDELIVCVELPGVSASDLVLAVNGGNIIIRGEKRPPWEEQKVGRRHLLERAYGGFERVISLNAPINTHRATATLRDGLLRIVFPKVDNRRGSEVRIPVMES